MDINIRRSSFHPNSSLENKSNHKTFYLLERDGVIFERIFLDLANASLREEVILRHYLSQLVKIFISEPVGVNILSRDKPWDFKVELSIQKSFNIEITSVADDQDLFEKFKREERLLSATLKEKVTIRELEKIIYFFPEKEVITYIENLVNAGTSKDSLIQNPLYGQKKHLFLSSRDYPKEPLENIIKTSIQKKENKKHSDKENTVLVIDNRTLMYEISDLETAIIPLDNVLAASAFKEIWFYTGYYSEVDGSNAEYSFAPLKISESQTVSWNKFMDNINRADV